MTNACDSRDTSFAIRISLGNALGFWVATVGPYWIDPQLTHFPKYGVRTYPHGWLIFPIGFSLGILTFFFLTRAAKQSRLYWNTLLFVLAGMLALPLFPPFPHGFVAGVCILFMLLSAITVWVHDQPIDADYANDPRIDRTARLERVKEEILLWRGSVVAVLVAYIALLVGWFNALREANLQVSPDLYERALLNSGSGIFVALTSVCVIFGPLAEAVKKGREAQNLLLKITV